MTTESPKTRMLQQALKIAGSFQRLAQHLRCDSAQLKRWLAGDEQMPPGVYLKVLDCVSHGSIPPPKRT